jgi:hypothetical protein
LVAVGAFAATFFVGSFALLDDAAGRDALLPAGLAAPALPALEDLLLALVPTFATAAVVLADAFAFVPDFVPVLGFPVLGLEAFLCVVLDIRLPFVAFDRSI